MLQDMLYTHTHAHNANIIAAKCIKLRNEKQISRKRSLSITLRETRGSRQSPAILLIPELRHDLTAETLYGVCHVLFLLSLMRLCRLDPSS